MSVPPPDRRTFLRLLGKAAAASALLPPWERARAALPIADVVTISILHTTDLHGHILPTRDYRGRENLGGLARCATQIRRWRAENPQSLLIDIGDIYQGTQFALGDQGRSMVDLFNLLRYDAWLIGNHEFDWGIDPFLAALSRSEMPVLAANTILEGKAAGAFSDAAHPFAKIRPFLLREIAGIRLAIVGLTTPGMAFWFPPEFTTGMEFPHPLEPVRRACAEAKSLGADAIVLAGHMGLKERTGGDDFANQVMTLTAEFPGTAAFIAGHTHQDIPSRLTNNVLFTQADHFGIHAGRLDLTFDRATKKLLHAQAHCPLMESSIPLDPVVLNRVQPQLDRAAAVLAEPIGELAENLSVNAPPGEPSDVERLLAAAIGEALAARGSVIDGVFHGLFDNRRVCKRGAKTIADIWEILPYENYLVSAKLLPNELEIVLNEVLESRESRSLAGFRFNCIGQGRERRLTNLRRADNSPLEPTKRYQIAFNTFDASSAGHRFLKLRELLERPVAQRTFHSLQTREALVAYFRSHKVVHRIPAASL